MQALKKTKHRAIHRQTRRVVKSTPQQRSSPNPLAFVTLTELAQGLPHSCDVMLQVVLNITNTFDSSFSRWTVGLGIEHQLNELRVAAGLPEESRFRARARNLDYALLVHPEVTLTHSHPYHLR